MYNLIKVKNSVNYLFNKESNGYFDRNFQQLAVC